jgi:hypothetical protein
MQLNREKHSHAGWCQHVRVGQSLPSPSSGHDQDTLFKSAGKVGCVDPGTDLHQGDQLAHVLRVRSFRKEIILMVTDGNTVRATRGLPRAFVGRCRPSLPCTGCHRAGKRWDDVEML